MMRLMRRNLTPVYYCLLDRKVPINDEDGNWTGEYKYIYADPVEVGMVAGARRGYVHGDFYGRLESSDRTLVASDTSLPIDVSTMIFLDKEPEYEDYTETYTEDGVEKTRTIKIPCGFNYSVRRVSKTLNAVSYILMEVKVG